MLVLILVAVEARSGMNEYGTNAIIPGRLRHIKRRQVQFRDRPRNCARLIEVLGWDQKRIPRMKSRISTQEKRRRLGPNIKDDISNQVRW